MSKVPGNTKIDTIRSHHCQYISGKKEQISEIGRGAVQGLV